MNFVAARFFWRLLFVCWLPDGLVFGCLLAARFSGLESRSEKRWGRTGKFEEGWGEWSGMEAGKRVFC